MNMEQKRELHNYMNACPRDVPAKADYIHFVAADNAGSTCTENGYPFEVGGWWTDEYIEHWYGTVIGCLADGMADADSEAWFADRGVIS